MVLRDEEIPCQIETLGGVDGCPRAVESIMTCAGLAANAQRHFAELSLRSIGTSEGMVLPGPAWK